jgi:hypothetical protein
LMTTVGGLSGGVSSGCMHRSSADDAPKIGNEHRAQMVPDVLGGIDKKGPIALGLSKGTC